MREPGHENNTKQEWGVSDLLLQRSKYSNWLNEQLSKTLKRISRFKFYYNNLLRIVKSIVPPGKKVLLFGCEDGWLISSLKPQLGLGVEPSDTLIQYCKSRHPDLQFINSTLDTLSLPSESIFDFVVIRDLAFTIDVSHGLNNIRAYTDSSSRVVIINTNPIWRPLFKLLSILNLRENPPQRSWITLKETRDFLSTSGFEVISNIPGVFIPFNLSLLSSIINSILSLIPILSRFAFFDVVVARKVLKKHEPSPNISVSIIVPCRNEEKNIPHIAERVQKISEPFELIFCDDKSTDNTKQEILKAITKYPEKNIKLIEGPGLNKASNVAAGFNAAKNDLLIILDADLAVMPEELHYVVELFKEDKAEFVNGSRLIYPLQDGSMNYLNFLGNKFFTLLVCILIRQSITDTLCGTKVIRKRDWIEKFSPHMHEWGVSDRWGDFELLFGASLHHLKIHEIAFHYQERVHGISKMIRVIENGVLMLRFCMAGYIRLHLKYR